LKRKAFILKRSKNGRKAICIDKKNASRLLFFLNQDERFKNKFRYISEPLLSGIPNTELYDKENINRKPNHVTAMKFFKGQENARIYCLEKRVNNQLFVIICCELVRSKKSQSNRKNIKSLIQKISSYEYQIEE